MGQDIRIKDLDEELEIQKILQKKLFVDANNIDEALQFNFDKIINQKNQLESNYGFDLINDYQTITPKNLLSTKASEILYGITKIATEDNIIKKETGNILTNEKLKLALSDNVLNVNDSNKNNYVYTYKGCVTNNINIICVNKLNKNINISGKFVISCYAESEYNSVFFKNLYLPLSGYSVGSGYSCLNNNNVSDAKKQSLVVAKNTDGYLEIYCKRPNNFKNGSSYTIFFNVNYNI